MYIPLWLWFSNHFRTARPGTHGPTTSSERAGGNLLHRSPTVLRQARDERAETSSSVHTRSHDKLGTNGRRHPPPFVVSLSNHGSRRSHSGRTHRGGGDLNFIFPAQRECPGSGCHRPVSWATNILPHIGAKPSIEGLGILCPSKDLAGRAAGCLATGCAPGYPKVHCRTNRRACFLSGRAMGSGPCPPRSLKKRPMAV